MSKRSLQIQFCFHCGNTFRTTNFPRDEIVRCQHCQKIYGIKEMFCASLKLLKESIILLRRIDTISNRLGLDYDSESTEYLTQMKVVRNFLVAAIRNFPKKSDFQDMLEVTCIDKNELLNLLSRR